MMAEMMRLSADDVLKRHAKNSSRLIAFATLHASCLVVWLS